MRLRTGDSVLVIRGRDRGKHGAVQQVIKEDGKVLVEGSPVELIDRHVGSHVTEVRVEHHERESLEQALSVAGAEPFSRLSKRTARCWWRA